MKITNQFREKYYPIFLEKARIIIGASLNLPPNEARDLASDFASKFLYSKSLLDHYDPTKGDVEPFFSSWVRKSLYSNYERDEKQWRSFAVLEDWMKSIPCSAPLDFEDWFYSIVSVLEGRMWTSGSLAIPYSRVFKYASMQILEGELWGDGVKYKTLAESLGIKPHQARRAFLSVTEYLRGKRRQGFV